jgi:iron complex transport system substrate-binding protein
VRQLQWRQILCALLAVANSASAVPNELVVTTPPRGPSKTLAPQRVMSLNLCTDQLLLALLTPERIASITWLSRTEGDPALLATARTIHANHGSAEEVLALRPDLVIAGRYTTARTRELLGRVGVPLLEVDPVTDWAGVRRVTRAVAAAVGAQLRAEQLIGKMDETLATLAARPARSLRVIGWGGSGEDVPGRDTFFNTILETVGAVNLAAVDTGRRSFDLEQVLLANPDLLMRGAAYAGVPALRNASATHPVLQRRLAGRMLVYPEAVYSCGVPRAADVALQLAAVLDHLPVAKSP